MSPFTKIDQTCPEHIVRYF